MYYILLNKSITYRFTGYDNYNIAIVGCKSGPANTINLCRRIYRALWMECNISATFCIYDIATMKCNEGRQNEYDKDINNIYRITQEIRWQGMMITLSSYYRIGRWYHMITVLIQCCHWPQDLPIAWLA